MRRFLSVLALCALVVAVMPLAACSCGGLPTLTLRSPVQVDQEPATLAGPRLMSAPAYYAPSYTPVAGACAPGFAGALPPGYTPGFSVTRPAAGPCDR